MEKTQGIKKGIIEDVKYINIRHRLAHLTQSDELYLVLLIKDFMYLRSQALSNRDQKLADEYELSISYLGLKSNIYGTNIKITNGCIPISTPEYKEWYLKWLKLINNLKQNNKETYEQVIQAVIKGEKVDIYRPKFSFPCPAIECDTIIKK